MMTQATFAGFETVRYEGRHEGRYEGPESRSALAYRWYDAERVVLGRRLGEHLRFAVAYWHSFVMNGSDPFGAPTLRRSWMAHGEAMAAARARADAAFEFFRVLDVPFFCFHDRDLVDETDTLAGTLRRLEEMTDHLARRMEGSRTRLLWGTANLFSHPRFMAGAATNPDPDVFAWSAATVKACLDATHALGGANYVLWGGREGYDTLLNTDMGRELEQLGRFLSLVVEYKHRIGFAGQILIEPKPREPTAHQYDFDAATVYGFLRRFGLEGEVKLNLEANHALLAGHSFEHEIATAGALGILGSLDVNRGDPLLGWDTDQFPNSLPEMTMAMLEVIRAGGLGLGGMNFDAKIRRQSIDLDDLVAAHVGAMDLCARAFLTAARIVEDGRLDQMRADRYAGWRRPEAQAMLARGASLEAIAATAEARGIDPQPRSGGQEKLENWLARFF